MNAYTTGIPYESTDKTALGPKADSRVLSEKAKKPTFSKDPISVVQVCDQQSLKPPYPGV